jgi:GNAT superfamily N-acetyltransferase
MRSERMTDPTLRLASLDDVLAITALIAASARGLCEGDYTAAQVEAALGTAWGCDTQLIHDGTYFVFEAGAELVACGGWSWRQTLFGSDAQPGRVADALDPERDAARIRAFFVHPDWARNGLGRALLAHCEAEAISHGFRAAELMATLPGVRLYRVCGYVGEERVEYPLPGGEVIAFVPMRKALTE